MKEEKLDKHQLDQTGYNSEDDLENRILIDNHYHRHDDNSSTSSYHSIHNRQSNIKEGSLNVDKNMNMNRITQVNIAATCITIAKFITIIVFILVDVNSYVRLSTKTAYFKCDMVTFLIICFLMTFALIIGLYSQIDGYRTIRNSSPNNIQDIETSPSKINDNSINKILGYTYSMFLGWWTVYSITLLVGVIIPIYLKLVIGLICLTAGSLLIAKRIKARNTDMKILFVTTSALFAFVVFMFLVNILQLRDDHIQLPEYTLSLTFHVVLVCISVVMMTYLRDPSFAFVNLLLQIGIFVENRSYLIEGSWFLVILSSICAISLLWFIFVKLSYKKNKSKEQDNIREIYQFSKLNECN